MQDYTALLANAAVEAVYCAVAAPLAPRGYCAAIDAGKHLMGEKPFGIDRPANDGDSGVHRPASGGLRAMLLGVSLLSGRSAHRRMIEAGAFGRIIEVNAGFLHSSDLDPQKPMNWKRIRQFNGRVRLPGRPGHARLPRAVSRRLDAAERARRAVEHRRRAAGRPRRDGALRDVGQRHAAVRRAELRPRVNVFPMTLKTQRIAPGERDTWRLEVLGTRASARFSTKNPKRLELLAYTGGEQIWGHIDMGQETAFKSITGGIFEFGFSDAILQMWAAFLL